jgi:hypothetical protein
MRTTIDLPDDLYRRTKAEAAMRGISMKEMIVRAVERSIDEKPHATPPKRVKLPLIPWKSEKKLDLSNFDFDELLG